MSSNFKRIRAMAKRDRLEAVLAAFDRPDGALDDQLLLAQHGLNSLANKDVEFAERFMPRAKGKQVKKTGPRLPSRSGKFLVQNPEYPTLYLTEHFTPGTHERIWGKEDIRRFRSERDAEIQIEWNGGRGVVVPESILDNPVNKSAVIAPTEASDLGRSL